ncbi:CgeB family protein [Mannheimia indoligenes]|uniref:CgeB family protein n=1 Tax=Mannheimia indoligenes TaxID=3103145 RepID=UPI002FE521DA
MSNIDKLLEKLKYIEDELIELKIAQQNEKRTISYQLGYILINNSKSIKGLLKIPRDLFELYKQNNARKIKSKQKDPLVIRSKENNVAVFPTKNLNINKISEPIRVVGLNKGLTLLDPISELCWKDAFTGFPLSRAEFEKQITTSTSQFAFFESAWRANNSRWLYAFTSPELKHSNAQALLKAIELLKAKGIPIIFWNKEDPMHYEMFKPIAKYADYIFTTDALVVNKYKQDIGHNNVYALPFAAPIKKTNPLGRFSLKTETICFAGTYYAKNHENRKKQMDMLLPTLLENNGCIYDRASTEQKEDYAYPAQYKDIIRPAVDFEEMVGLYKKFQVFLNVNTITQSTTMMSRRVYELLASGTPVISTPSKAITEQFPGIVLTVNNEEEAKLAARKLLTDSYFWHKQSMLGIREVMYRHTYKQRWMEVENVVLGKVLDDSQPNIRVICIYHGYMDLDFFLKSIIQQNNVNISEIIVIKSNRLEVDAKILDKYKAKAFDFGCFNIRDYLGKSSNINYTFITDDRVYNFDNSIWGMSLAFKYTDVPAVIRSHYYKYSKLNDVYNYEIDSPNWYERMREVPTSCVLIDDNKHKEIVIDLNNKKVKSIDNKANILMIDPFNLVGLDNMNILKDTQKLQQFIYKTAPYLGV